MTEIKNGRSFPTFIPGFEPKSTSDLGEELRKSTPPQEQIIGGYTPQERKELERLPKGARRDIDG